MGDEVTAFYFDRAVFAFGTALESALEAASHPGKGKNKKNDVQIAMARQQVMSRWLGLQQFAEPPRRQ